MRSSPLSVLVALAATACGLVACGLGGCDAVAPGVPLEALGAPVAGTEEAVVLGPIVGLPDRRPRVDPGGRLVAWVREGAPASVVVTGGGPERVVTVSGGVSGVGWSPAGNGLVVGAGFRVSLVDLAGGAVRPLVTSRSVSPRWSPDGARVAYVETSCEGGADDCGLAVIGVDGSGRRGVAPYWSSPAWHPDGCRVFGSVPLPLEGAEGIGVADVCWGGAAVLDGARHATVRGLDVSPDGARVTYEAEDGIWVADVDGGAARRVVERLRVAPPGADGPAAHLASSPSWHPDGRLVYDLLTASVYRTGDHGASVAGVRTVYAAALD